MIHVSKSNHNQYLSSYKYIQPLAAFFIVFLLIYGTLTLYQTAKQHIDYFVKKLELQDNIKLYLKDKYEIVEESKIIILEKNKTSSTTIMYLAETPVGIIEVEVDTNKIKINSSQHY